MRSALVLILLIASPAAACGFDGMFGFNHYSDMASDQAAADAMRDAAIAKARDKFMERHGIVQVAESDAMSSTTQAVTSGSGELAVAESNGATPQ